MTSPDRQREAERNRLLRRVDWRFLLPNPRPRRSLCFADGLLAQAVAHISGAMPRGAINPPDGYDLAVAVNPTSVTLKTAAAALQPGGAFYSEWYAPWSGGPRRVRRRLAAAGFEEITCYWPWPWPARASAHFWAPIQAPRVLDYFIAQRPQPRSLPRRVAQAVRLAAWRLAQRTGLTLPVCVTARKPSYPVSRSLAVQTGLEVDGVSQATAFDLLTSIRAGWETWGLGPRPTRLDRLLLTGGLRSINKPVLLVFADGEPRPRLAVKMARVPEAIPGLVREAAVLRAVHALQPGGIKGVPRPLFSQADSGFLSGQTALDGAPVATLVRPANYRRLAGRATDWLIQLAGRGRHQARQAWWDRLVEPTLAEFSAMFGPVAPSGLLAATRARLATLDSLPLVCEQRDFSPWNVLVDSEGELVVLDWESAEPQGLPLLDLIYFLTYLAFFLDGAMASGRTRQAYRASLDPSSFTGQVRAECLARYCHQLGLDPATARPLALLTWLLHARSEYQRLVADAGGAPDQASLRHSLFVALWEEELLAQ